MVTATCTYGDGPDVMIDLEDKRFVLYETPQHFNPPMGDYKHGVVNKGSYDLTHEEALRLGHDLIAAAKAAEKLEKDLNN